MDHHQLHNQIIHQHFLLLVWWQLHHVCCIFLKKKKFIFYLFFIFKACDLFELNGNPKYISDIQTDPFIFQEYLFPRGSGANFNKLPVTIIISLTPEQTRKYLEFEFTDKKTNIKDYIIKIYDNSNNIIKVLNETSSTNRIVILPRVVISESKIISKIEIVIISTTDRNPPIHVKISIKGFNTNGCESTTQFILTSSTTTPLSTSFILSSSTPSATKTRNFFY